MILKMELLSLESFETHPNYECVFCGYSTSETFIYRNHAVFTYKAGTKFVSFKKEIDGSKDHVVCSRCFRIFYCYTHKDFDKCKYEIKCSLYNCSRIAYVDKPEFKLYKTMINFHLNNYFCSKHFYECEGFNAKHYVSKRCENKYVNLKTKDITANLPNEVKIIILKYFQSINGCGGHPLIISET